MKTRFLAAPLMLFIAGAVKADAQRLCRPTLAITHVRFSEMQPPSGERTWSAVVAVDASQCATSSGRFSIGFLRIKEDGGELEFRQSFTWSAPKVRVSVQLWADEAVESYWIDAIGPCLCERSARPGAQ